MAFTFHLKENYKYYRMGWAKMFRLPYDFCDILIQGLLNRVKLGSNQAKTRNELEYLIIVSNLPKL